MFGNAGGYALLGYRLADATARVIFRFLALRSRLEIRTVRFANFIEWTWVRRGKRIQDDLHCNHSRIRKFNGAIMSHPHGRDSVNDLIDRVFRVPQSVINENRSFAAQGAPLSVRGCGRGGRKH